MSKLANHTRRPRRPPRGRRGYVLLMVLLLLTIAAAAMAGVCRMSMEKALLAAREREDLQRRWGSLSCRSALLPKAEAALSRAEKAAAGPPAAEARMDLRLGDRDFVLIFGDEQAKANVNAIYRHGGLAAAERAVREISVASGASLRTELRPLRATRRPRPAAPRAAGADDPDPPRPVEPREEQEQAEDEEAPAFETLAQVFGPTPPGKLLARRGAAPPVAANVTCWGDGVLNLRRASAPAAEQALRPWLAQAQVTRLLAARDEALRQGGESWDALESLNISEPKLEALEEVLTDESSCHSLWVISRDAGVRGREWHDLSVAGSVFGEEGDGSDETVSFSW